MGTQLGFVFYSKQMDVLYWSKIRRLNFYCTISVHLVDVQYKIQRFFIIEKEVDLMDDQHKTIFLKLLKLFISFVR